MFKNKKKDTVKCDNCREKINPKYSFCPHCGISFIDEEQDSMENGMLGKTDSQDLNNIFGGQNLGMMDKMLGSIMNSLVKSLDKELNKELRAQGKTEVRSFPNGIKIKINGTDLQEQPQKQIQTANNAPSSKQIKKMSNLPRGEAKSNVRRLSDRIVYELATPGLESKEDVFVSKLESGYEVKAIGSKKVYVNSIPLNLPLKRLSLIKNKLLVEFKSDQN